jgi:hypothetical protein
MGACLPPAQLDRLIGLWINHANGFVPNQDMRP